MVFGPTNTDAGARIAIRVPRGIGLRATAQTGHYRTTHLLILNANNDNFVTRWLVNHQWKTWIQYEKECEIETTLEYCVKFMYQCSRWARSNWTSLVKERYPWCTYALHLATFSSLAFIGDPLILPSLWWGHGQLGTRDPPTSWGSRLDSDAQDSLRMAPSPNPHESTVTPEKRFDDLDNVLANRNPHGWSASVLAVP
ncbi:hypothetical protein PG994_015176 [Apiospora phragmitis]|uniref:Uncharacterized protein n=1 Tax=Apiospora phragmitis TaxID=2905665 RepID=A0ABR1SVQ6_9PEZI